MKKRKWSEETKHDDFKRFCAVCCVIGMVISILCGIIFWKSICWALFLAFIGGFVVMIDRVE